MTTKDPDPKKTSIKQPEWPDIEEAEGWNTSRAKELLLDDIRAGNIPDDMAWQEAYEQRPEYILTIRDRFYGRLSNARKEVLATNKRAEGDAVAWDHDRKLHPRPVANYRGEPTWEGSEAQTFMKLDVKDTIDNSRPICPIDLYLSREEYFEHYELSTIRQHIYQECRSGDRGSHSKG